MSSTSAELIPTEDPQPSSSLQLASQPSSQPLPTPPSTTTALSSTAPNANTTSSPHLDTIIGQLNSTNPPSPFQLSQTLKSLAGRENVLSGLTSTGADPLAPGVIDLGSAGGTVAALYILSARLTQDNALPVPGAYVEEFCSRFDPVQARISPERVTLLAKGIVQLAEAQNKLKIAISPLYDLLARYPPDLSYLTTIHPIFLSICLQSQHLTPALPVLATPIAHISMQLVPDLTYIDHLLHHYTAGCILALLKRFVEAADAWEVCVGAPVGASGGSGSTAAGPGPVPQGMGIGMAMATRVGGGGGVGEPSALQMEAMKKLVLVQLILYGKTQPTPKYTHPTLASVRNTPYGALAKAYPRGPLQSIIHKERNYFESDQNMGLVKQALDRAPRWAIKKLTETYLTLGLAEIGKEVGIDDGVEVRRLVLSMIALGEINASISADGTVTFADDVPAAVSKADMDRVLRVAQEQELILRALEREMARSRSYLSKAVKSREDGPGGWAGGQDEDLVGPSHGQALWAEESLF